MGKVVLWTPRSLYALKLCRSTGRNFAASYGSFGPVLAFILYIFLLLCIFCDPEGSWAVGLYWLFEVPMKET